MILSKDNNNVWTATAGGNNNWIGTSSQFESAESSLPVNTIAYITDGGIQCKNSDGTWSVISQASVAMKRDAALESTVKASLTKAGAKWTATADFLLQITIHDATPGTQYNYQLNNSSGGYIRCYGYNASDMLATTDIMMVHKGDVLTVDSSSTYPAIYKAVCIKLVSTEATEPELEDTGWVKIKDSTPYVYLRKIGKVVYCRMGGDNSVYAPGAVICNIPQGFQSSGQAFPAALIAPGVMGLLQVDGTLIRASGGNPQTSSILYSTFSYVTDQ